MHKSEYELRVNSVLVHVTRKCIKNMYLRVKRPDARISVNAPLFVSDDEICRFVNMRMDWIKQAQLRVLVSEEERAKQPELSPELEKLHRTYLKSEITNLIAKWEPVMNVHPTGFSIRKMKTRWGSCNVKTHHMNFNLSLARVPARYLEYVVVHEMTHLLEPSHNVRFWDYMEYYLPETQKLRKELNKLAGIN